MREAVCGATLAELHEQDLLAMGVEKLGHRKIIMQAIRVLFGQEDTDGDVVTVDPTSSAGSRNALHNDASVEPVGTDAQQTSKNTQEKTGTV